MTRRIRFWLYWVLAKMSKVEVTIEGVPIRALSTESDEQTRSALEKIRAAIHLVGEHAPGRLSQLRADFNEIWIAPTGGPLAQWHDDLKVCQLDSDWLETDHASVSRIAMALVHEATHAKLRRRGLATSYRNRARVEAMCFRAEMAFARKLPDSSELQAAIAYKLEYYDGRWTGAEFVAMKFNMLKKLGYPRWLADWLTRRFVR